MAGPSKCKPMPDFPTMIIKLLSYLTALLFYVQWEIVKDKQWAMWGKKKEKEKNIRLADFYDHNLEIKMRLQIESFGYR